jgi:hypothetical protein
MLCKQQAGWIHLIEFCYSEEGHVVVPANKEAPTLLATSIHSIFVLLVLHVKVDCRLEETSSFTGTHNLRNVELVEENHAMVHDLLCGTCFVYKTPSSVKIPM